MIVFFSISGSLQVFALHEAHGAYKPSSLISAMAGLHKNQVFAPEPQRGAGRPEGPQGESAPPRGPQGRREKPKPTLATQALKLLFVLEALTLVATTLLGVWIGVTHPKRARTFCIILAAGTLLPIALMVV